MLTLGMSWRWIMTDRGATAHRDRLTCRRCSRDASEGQQAGEQVAAILATARHRLGLVRSHEAYSSPAPHAAVGRERSNSG